MKKQILCYVFALAAAFATAQTPTVEASTSEVFTAPFAGSWLGKFEKKQLKVMQTLSLTETQKHQLDVLNDQYVTQRAALFDDKSLKRRARNGQIKGLREERNTKFQTMLTAEQRDKWDDLRRGKQKKLFRKK